MKKFLSLLLVLTLLFSVASCAPSNNEDTPPAADAATCRVVIGTDPVTEYTVDFSSFVVDEGLMSLLKHLRDTKGLTFTEESGAYGAFLTSVGSLVAGDSSYISIYTSVPEDFDVSAYATTMTYDGVTLTSSGFGASSMKIKDGAIYYISLSTF